MKLIADDMLGRLAKWLRILGFDTLYFPAIGNYDLLHRASLDGRTILTRDRKLPQKTLATPIFLIESDHYLKQVVEVVKKLDLKIDDDKIFSLCLDCNTKLAEVPKEKAKGLVPPYVFERHSSFHQCSHCQKVFWGGSHYSNSLKALRSAFTV